MTIHEVMTPNVEFISPDQSLVHAAKRMRDRDIGSLPVGENDRLIGMITDRDIAVRSTAEGRNPEKTTVRDVMSDDIIYSYEDQKIEEAAHLMKERKIRRLVVLNRDKRMVGVLSLGDLVTGTQNRQLAGDVLENVANTSTEK